MSTIRRPSVSHSEGWPSLPIATQGLMLAGKRWGVGGEGRGRGEGRGDLRINKQRQEKVCR